MLEIEVDGSVVTIAWYYDEAGVAHGREYYEALDPATRAKFVAPMNYVANQPRYRNKEKFRDEGDGLFAIKIFKHRLMCFRDGRLLIITHGFVKKSDDLPSSEKQRATRLRDEYHERKG